MKYLDEFRDDQRAQLLIARIRAICSRRWVIMEVCGGQTHGLLKHGIEELLQDSIEMLHGPGCPVCVTPIDVIDHAQELAQQPGVMLASFGDMLRVPGTRGSLLNVRAQGGNVRLVYSPLDAVALAEHNPEQQIVFLAVGFETTAPATALAVLQSHQKGIKNFCVLVHHVRVEPAMAAIMKAPEVRVQAFLAAGHVCTVMGYDNYSPFVQRFRTPIAITGFEPLDLLVGLLEVVQQLEAGRASVKNCYQRSVAEHGNLSAQQLIEQVYDVTDQHWRGIGLVHQGGYQMKSCWHDYDAQHRFPRHRKKTVSEHFMCRAGEVLSGRLRPIDCPSFGKECTPDTPLGAPMVSSEGACAAYHRYRLSQDLVQRGVST